MSIYITENFKHSEFRCPDCGKDKPIDPHFIYLLQSLREKIGEPIYVTKGGGLRCRKYNRKIGGYRNSAHLTGKAVDCRGKYISLIDFVRVAKSIGFSRIGLYKSFIHIDILRPSPSASWIRDKNKKYHYFKSLEEAIIFAKTIQLW